MSDPVAALSRALSRTALYVSAAGLVGMTFVIGWQVFGRYVLGQSPPWAEPAALFLMLWFILFAAAVGVREQFHIRIMVLDDALPPRIAAGLRIVCHLIVLAFGVSMAAAGADLAAATWEHAIPTLGLPRGLSYAPLMIAGALIVFFSLEHVAALLRGRAVEPLWN